MVDPTDLVGPVIGALAGGKVTEKVMGPTADLLGTQLRDLTERGQRNTGRVLSVAFRRLRADQDDGQVPPKVMKEFVDQAPWTEDELTAEYLGGVLASSRTESPRDDRAASLIALIGRLSTYQLRGHYVFHRELHRLASGYTYNFGMQNERQVNAKMAIPLQDFAHTLELTSREAADFGGIMSHMVTGLIREGLLDDEYGWGSPSELGQLLGGRVVQPDVPTFVATPSLLGIELYFHALNRPGDPAQQLRVPPVAEDLIEGVPALPTAVLVQSLPTPGEGG